MLSRVILVILALSACKCPERIIPIPPPRTVQVEGVSFEVAPIPISAILTDTILVIKDTSSGGRVTIRTEYDTLRVEVDCPDQEIIVQPEGYEVRVIERKIDWKLVIGFSLVIGFGLYRIFGR